MKKSRLLSLLVFLTSALFLHAQQPAEIHGVIRAKYEYEPQIQGSRFQVRNARANITGQITPSVGYKAEIDLSDEGKIKMLDAYARFKPTELPLHFTIGQMRVPFTIDAHRSPADQYFANRSFIAKQVGNIRDVGAMLSYTIPNYPLILQGGIFNGSGLTEQKEWHNTLNYSCKLTLPLNRFSITLGAQDAFPDSIRSYSWNIGSFYQNKHWHIEAEYILKHYEKDAFSDVHAFNFFVNYNLFLKRTFQKISFLSRYDYMSNHSDGLGLKAGKLPVTDYKRHRLTGGITLSLAKPFISDIRINYEKYFYAKNAIIKESEQDKFVIEFTTRF